MFISDFRKKGVCSKSVRKTLYWNKFFGKWMHFQISLSLWELQVIRDLLCVGDIVEKSLNKLSLLIILKGRCISEVYLEKDVLKNFANFKGKHLCWSLFLIKLRSSGPATLFKRDSNAIVFQWNLRNFSEHLCWKRFVNHCFCIFM